MPPMLLPTAALNVVVAEPAGTVIVDAGTGSSPLLLESATEVPPAGAAWLRVTVHIVLAPEAKLVGLQESEDRTTGATKLIAVACETPFSVAVRVAL